MTSLRTKEGLQLNSETGFNSMNIIKTLKRKSAKFQEQKLLYENSDALALTNEGKLYADGIAAELFFEDYEIMGAGCVAGS